mgnify:CR=1 FL=1
MDQWTNWVRVKTCGKTEYNTSTEIVTVKAWLDGYSYAVVASAVARDLCIRHKFEYCKPPAEAQTLGEEPQEAKKEEKPARKRAKRTRKKAAPEE